MRAVALWTMLGSCTPRGEESQPPPGTTTTPVPTPQPEPGLPLEILSVAVAPPDNPDVYLVEQVDVSMNREGVVRLTVIGPEGAPRQIDIAKSATTIHFPLIGLLADTDYTIDVTVTSLDGQVATSLGHRVHTGALPLVFPNIAVLALDEAAVEPGWIVAAPWTGSVDQWVVLLDGRGRPVFAYHPSQSWRAVSVTDHGTFIGLQGNEIIEASWLGTTVRVFGSKQEPPVGIPVADADLTHECLPLADGSIWTLIGETATVDNFPLDYDFTTFATTDIEDTVVVHYAADGTTLDRFSMVDLLDEHRLGYMSLDLAGSKPGLPDWGHGNAALYDPVDDAVLVSLRHQDAVVKFARSTGEIQWILANHDGWAPEFVPFLLTPVGDPFQWPGHQHAPMWLPGDKIVMFDNGNHGRGTPYGTVGGNTVSRVVQFSIDEEAMTIEQDWDWVAVPGGNAFSLALGNADLQPTTGNVLATFSYLFAEGGVDNTDLGRGNITTRVIEFAPATGAVVRDLDLWGDALVAPDGWLVDRASPVTTLYGVTASDSADGLD